VKNGERGISKDLSTPSSKSVFPPAKFLTPPPVSKRGSTLSKEWGTEKFHEKLWATGIKRVNGIFKKGTPSNRDNRSNA